MQNKTLSALAVSREESYKLAYQRGGHKRLVLARAKYLLPATEPAPRVAAPTPPLVEAGLPDPASRPAAAPSLAAVAPAPPQLHTVPVPKEVVSRRLAAPSLLAHILVDKFCDGLPLHRIEDRLAREGVCVDRGTMSRWVEHLGATLGATVVHAARTEALATAFCLATDATSIPIQPNSPTGPVGAHAVVGDGDDAGVLDDVDGAGLVQEARAQLFFRVAVQVQYLEGDVDADVGLAGRVDRAHAAAPEPPLDAVAADQHANQRSIQGIIQGIGAGVVTAQARPSVA